MKDFSLIELAQGEHSLLVVKVNPFILNKDVTHRESRMKWQLYFHSNVLSGTLSLSKESQAATISPSKCWKMTLLDVSESSLLTQSQINTIILGRSPCWKLPENNTAQKSLLNSTRPIDGLLNYAWRSGTIQVHTLVTWHLFLKWPEFILDFHSIVFFMCSIKSLLSLRHMRQFKLRCINVQLSV